MAPMSRAAWGLGSIYQRKDGRWVGQTERHGQRRYVYGQTADEVRAKLLAPWSPTSRPSASGSVAESLRHHSTHDQPFPAGPRTPPLRCADSGLQRKRRAA
jgi:hypothetical protein